MLTFRTVDQTLSPEIRILAATAKQEGFSHVERLVSEWDGGFRFDHPEEMLLTAWRDDVLVAVGGVTVDPVRADALRMRRFYVHPDYRRQGVGRSLALALLDHALSFDRPLFVHAGTAVAPPFWEALGFSKHEQDGHTHHFVTENNQEEYP